MLVLVTWVTCTLHLFQDMVYITIHEVLKPYMHECFSFRKDLVADKLITLNRDSKTSAQGVAVIKQTKNLLGSLFKNLMYQSHNRS